jgi:hypothetical protein
MKLETPFAAGEPETTPVVAAKTSPAGRAPLVTDQVYGTEPPVAANPPLYALFTMPPGRTAELIASGAGPGAATDNVKATVADCCGDPLSVTVTLKENAPLAVGAPERTPVAAARASPAGKLPEATLQVKPGVPPVALSSWL